MAARQLCYANCAPLIRAAQRWLLVPEAAPLLFQAGLDGRRQSFQQAVAPLQIALEESCVAAAHPQQVLLCHRGTLDALAYWMRNGWDEGEFFAATGMSREEHYRRYFGVIHLQSAAIGAEGFYRRWPDAHRPETIEQAAEIDRLRARAWSGHPRHVLVDNLGKDWLTKSNQQTLGHLFSSPAVHGWGSDRKLLSSPIHWAFKEL